MCRVGALVFCVGLLLTALTGGARAETAVCADLQRQLSAALSGGGGGSAQQVASQLIRQQAEAGANGCAGFNPGKPATAQCPAIMASLRQLRADLARAQARSGSSPAMLRGQLARNGCRERTTVAGGGPRLPGGAGRTICVRTCDGYFFPIGNVDRRNRYKTDAEVCQSMYASAGEAELFVQRRRDDIATAVSVDGKLAYADQPYAFIFKHVFSRSCQAQLHGGLTALGARYYEALRSMPPKTAAKGKASEVAAVEWPPPRLRPPAIGEDPETVAVRAGDLAEVFLKPAKDEVATAGRRTIRQVGESWYSTLHGPDRPPDPPPTYRPPLGFDLIGAAKAARASEMEAAAMIVDVLTQ